MKKKKIELKKLLLVKEKVYMLTKDHIENIKGGYNALNDIPSKTPSCTDGPAR